MCYPKRTFSKGFGSLHPFSLIWNLLQPYGVLRHMKDDRTTVRDNFAMYILLYATTLPR